MTADQAPPGLLAVVPAHDEAPRIQGVVHRLRARGLPVLVVDDGSHDDTEAQAEHAGADVLRLDPNRGKGGALKAGFARALGGDAGCEAILTLDGDGQHDPAEAPAFWAAWRATGADLVIGARDYRQMPPVRRLTNTVSRRILSHTLGTDIPDNQSGYRLYSRRLAEAILESPEQGFAFEVDAIAICLARAYRLTWVPIATIYGDERSDIRPWTHLVGFLRVNRMARERLRAERGRANARA